MGRGLLGVVFFSSVFVASAQDEQAVRPVEAYQIQSQYGPEVAVLNPIFDKNKTFEFSLTANYSPTSSLYDFAGVAAGVSYHINRRHSVDSWLQYNFLGEMSAFAQTEIKDKCPGVAGCNPNALAIDIPRMIAALTYTFTPYYTKMHITDLKVVHMDIVTSLGPAMVMTEEDRFNGSTGETNWRFGGVLAAGLRVQARDRWGMRLELRDVIHQAKNVGTDEIVNDVQLTVGGSVFLDAFPNYND